MFEEENRNHISDENDLSIFLSCRDICINENTLTDVAISNISYVPKNLY